MIDATQGMEGIRKDMRVLARELDGYDEKMLDRTRLLLLNKIDLPEGRDGAKKVSSSLEFPGESILAVSAATGEGVEKLLDRLVEIMENNATL
jgi:GTP-binding protein